MKKNLFGLVVVVLGLTVTLTGKGQRLSDYDKPVWTMEFIQVHPGMFGPTLGYLDDNWMRVREEAKRQGAVLRYERLVQSPQNDKNIVLITEFKNSNAYLFRDTLFESIRNNLPKSDPSISRVAHESLFVTVDTAVYQDCPEPSNLKMR